MRQLIFLSVLFLIPFLMNAQHNGTGNPTGETTTASYGHQADTKRRYNSNFGYRAGFSISTGEHNSHFGYRAGLYTSTGGKNTCLGVNTGLYNKTGTHNTYVGTNAGIGGSSSGSNGSHNVYVGNNAGYKSTSGGLNTYVGRNAGYFNTTGARNVFIGSSAGQNEMGSDKLYINNNANAPLIYGDFSADYVGIAIDPAADIVNPTMYGLYVGKGILTEKVKVANVGTNDWADYVFAEDYKLNTIEEVENFVKANKHLPNVPSAKEVSENGVDMVKMDATLLRQIEELWLHVIEMKKYIAELETQLDQK